MVIFNSYVKLPEGIPWGNLLAIYCMAMYGLWKITIKIVCKSGFHSMRRAKTELSEGTILWLFGLKLASTYIIHIYIYIHACTIYVYCTYINWIVFWFGTNGHCAIVWSLTHPYSQSWFQPHQFHGETTGHPVHLGCACAACADDVSRI